MKKDNQEIVGDNIPLEESQHQKLTKWKNEPTIADLKGDFERAEEVQKMHIAKVEEWNDLISVKGAAKPKARTGRSSYQPQLIRRQNEWRYSALTEPFHSNEDLIRVEPVTFEDYEGAKQNTLLINYQYRTKIDRIKFIDDVVRATVDEGTCIVRVGWKRETEMVEEEFPVWNFYPIQDEESMAMLEQAAMYKQENPRGFDEDTPEDIKEAVSFTEESGTPVKAVQVGTEKRQVEKVLENYPTVDVMDLRNVYIDPTCRSNLDDALFVINTYEVNQAELLKNRDLYKNLDKINWRGDSANDADFLADSDFKNFEDPMRRKKVAYDYWGYYDIHDNGTLEPVLITWIDNVIIRAVDNPYPDGKPPFVIMNYMPVKRKIYGEPDAELLKDNQALAGAMHRSAIDIIARSANAQTAVFKGALDGVNRIRFENEENFEVNPNGHPTGGIINLIAPEIPGSLMNMMELNNFETEALTGVKSFSGGLSGDAYGKVATNTRGMLDAASKREMAILRRIAAGIKNVSNKLIAMNMAFLSKEETVRVTNNEYVTVTKEDIKGNFDLIVDISTAEVDEAKSNDLGFLLQTIGNTVDPSLTQVVLAEIIELKKMPRIAHIVRTFQKEPSPEEQEMMQIEMELKRKELEKLQADIDLANAKAMEAMAKANSTEVGTNKVLDGSSHQEAMAKTQAQAEANRALEADKASYARQSKLDDKILGLGKGEGKSMPKKAPIEIPDTPAEREQYKKDNPIFNLGSSKFDPEQDPALNPAMNRL